MNDFFKHEKALVDNGAKIGKGTRVWAFAHVMAGAEIGENCNIGNYAFVESGAKLGNQVTVKNGVQIWEGVEAEDGVFFGPNCVLTNDMRPRSFIRLPKEEYLRKTKIKRGATIGANATIVCDTIIGEYAFIAAGAVVTRDVPAFALMAGCPATRKAWVCVCAETLRFTHNKTHCEKCGKAFELREDEVRLLD